MQRLVQRQVDDLPRPVASRWRSAASTPNAPASAATPSPRAKPGSVGGPSRLAGQVGEAGERLGQRAEAGQRGARARLAEAADARPGRGRRWPRAAPRARGPSARACRGGTPPSARRRRATRPSASSRPRGCERSSVTLRLLRPTSAHQSPTPSRSGPSTRSASPRGCSTFIDLGAVIARAASRAAARRRASRRPPRAAPAARPRARRRPSRADAGAVGQHVEALGRREIGRVARLVVRAQVVRGGPPCACAPAARRRPRSRR